MKLISTLAAASVLGLVACDTMTAPLSNSGDFDPLRPPGSNLKKSTTVAGPSYKAGQFVRASMGNTAFFKNRPKGDADADKLLSRGTSMKVISTSGSYLKVELDNGEVGFVPSVMVENPNAATPTAATTGRPGEFQVYPPLPMTGGNQPLPALDPAGLPPDGAIPTVIDPEAPAVQTPLPKVTPTTDQFATPATPPLELKPPSTPLPPNGEELKAAGEKIAEKVATPPPVEAVVPKPAQ
jgi:hypothetical protein